MDVEALVHSVLSPLGGIVSWQYDAQTLWPREWLEVVSVQVDVRASSKKRTRDRAYQARALLIDLPGSYPDGIVTDVQITSGPFWLADDDGRPRYVLRASVWTHPARVPVLRA